VSGAAWIEELHLGVGLGVGLVARLVDVRAVVGVHLKHAADALLLVLHRVEHRVTLVRGKVRGRVRCRVGRLGLGG
jgi:hypothetical protein